MKVILISLTLIFLFSVCAEGSDWELFFGYEGNILYIYKKSIQHPSKNIVRAWTKMKCLKNCETYPKNIMRESKTYYEHDCKEIKYRILEAVHYYTDGTVKTSEASGKWKYVVPDTIQEHIHRYLCKDK